jgi:hypothetical protein
MLILAGGVSMRSSFAVAWFYAATARTSSSQALQYAILASWLHQLRPCVQLPESLCQQLICHPSDTISRPVFPVPQLLGCRGALAEREAGNIFATPARIHKIPNHAE